MPNQNLALIQLQKRMLDADMPRRAVAIAAAGAIGLIFLSPLQVAGFVVSYAVMDWALAVSLNRLEAAPDDPWRMRVVQLAAFAAMSVYLLPAVMLWLLPGATPKIGAMLHVFGSMLSVMLVRTVLTPMVIANSLPLGVLIIVIAMIERSQIPPREQLFLGVALTILGGYFAITLRAAQRINQERAREHHAALARVETQQRFLATMSHELRTPLNGILGMAQTLIARHPGEDSAQGAEVIRDSARDMAALVDDLLDNAAIEAGALRINRKPTDLAVMMARIQDRWQPAYAAKGLTLDMSRARNLPKAAMIDPLRLSQCLSNLLANALRMTAQGGVTLTLSRHAVGLEAVVTDTGPGLALGTEARLFRPFETLQPPSQGVGPSSGLGLAITRGLAQAMGGDLRFERPSSGGSRFRLTLSAPEVETLPETEVLSADLRGKRILLVDDIATNLLVLRLWVSAAGATSIEAGSGATALDLLADPGLVPPDAVLMDICMPDLSGFDTLARMRAMGLRCPIIAVSADAAPEERAEALAHGFDGYLTKPVEAAELHRVLAQALAG